MTRSCPSCGREIVIVGAVSPEALSDHETRFACPPCVARRIAQQRVSEHVERRQAEPPDGGVGCVSAPQVT